MTTKGGSKAAHNGKCEPANPDNPAPTTNPDHTLASIRARTRWESFGPCPSGRGCRPAAAARWAPILFSVPVTKGETYRFPSDLRQSRIHHAHAHSEHRDFDKDHPMAMLFKTSNGCKQACNHKKNLTGTSPTHPSPHVPSYNPPPLSLKCELYFQVPVAVGRTAMEPELSDRSGYRTAAIG